MFPFLTILRSFLFAAAGAVAGFGAMPALHLGLVAAREAQYEAAAPVAGVDDASHLDATSDIEVWPVPEDALRAERELAALLARARAEHLPVSIGGARHTMGGHTIAPGGISIDMRPFRAMEYDEATGLLECGAGAAWDRILPYLNARGRSVHVMQSNNSFSVGGSLGANCHGWQSGMPPIVSTVESFRLMLADGRIVRCSRGENRELFSLVPGGYGLFGVVLDVELRTVPNEAYRTEFHETTVENYVADLERAASTEPRPGMVYGRLSVAPSTYLRVAYLTVYRPIQGTQDMTGTLRPLPIAGLRRLVFRGSVGSAYGKGLRSQLEGFFGRRDDGHTVWRNALLNEPVTVYENRDPGGTDILHEYFVPPDRFARFVASVREIVPRHGADLLNVTVRDIRRDDDAFLRYADRGMIGLVMLFHQRKTPEGEEKMRAVTRDLIDAALAAGGRYYLPYRLHATREQFAAAYPQGARFFELKRRHDPGELFRNMFYEAYGE